MADKENRRKCFKCGRSPAVDDVKLFRFPKPAVRNLSRCLLWAKYVFPDRDYLSVTLQKKLHDEHRMLCQMHFSDSSFADDSKKIIMRTAVPFDDISNVNLDQQGSSYIQEPQPGPSYTVPLAELKNQSVTVTQTTNRESKLYAKCSKYLRQVCALRNRIKRLKLKKALEIINEDENVNKLTKKMSPAFALLLQGQIKNFKKKGAGRRWSNEAKITALRIFKKSPTCYKLLRRLFCLPAPPTLRNLLNKINFEVGPNHPVFKTLTNFVKTHDHKDNAYVLMFDEMSLKKNLKYNTKTDLIEGYQDHAKQGRSSNIAGYALVFMIAGIRKRVKQPIAHYFSSGFSTADRLAVLIKEVLQNCKEAGIDIQAIVCDCDGVNRRAYSILGASQQRPSISFEDKEIICLFDTPHLLKCFRNLFIKYDIHCNINISSNNKSGEGIAKWAHIKEFYAVDNASENFVFAPCLTKDHLNPNSKQKMKVKLAAQVMSHTVAAGMYAKISQQQLTTDATVTADLVSKMDKLFDCLNSDCPDLRRGKPYGTNLRSTTPHLEFIQEMKLFFSKLKYIGSSRIPPSHECWLWTLTAVPRLWHKMVQSHKIRSLSTRRLQQDPIENLFGCIRNNCGSNTNPTCGQFTAALKTAILSNLSHIGIKGNCETDNNQVIDNFKTMLSVSQPEYATHVCAEPESSNISINDLDPDDSEIQASTYVCGFILKKISGCEQCVKSMKSKALEGHHLFVEYKEYNDKTKNLTYVTKDMAVCVEQCASIVNDFLKEKGHLTNLRSIVIEHLKSHVNYEFLNNCLLHKEENILKIIISVFYICVKRFCVLQNRKFAEEASAASLKRKINIICHR